MYNRRKVRKSSKRKRDCDFVQKIKDHIFLHHNLSKNQEITSVLVLVLYTLILLIKSDTYIECNSSSIFIGSNIYTKTKYQENKCKQNNFKSVYNMLQRRNFTKILRKLKTKLAKVQPNNNKKRNNKAKYGLNKNHLIDIKAVFSHLSFQNPKPVCMENSFCYSTKIK